VQEKEAAAPVDVIAHKKNSSVEKNQTPSLLQPNKKTMIIYALVSVGSTVLAEYTATSGTS